MINTTSEIYLHLYEFDSSPNIEYNFSVQQNRILKECEKEGSENETDEDEEEDFDLHVNIDPNLVSLLKILKIFLLFTFFYDRLLIYFFSNPFVDFRKNSDQLILLPSELQIRISFELPNLSKKILYQRKKL